MDFTPDLSAFQGVIISADNVHPFSRLTEKGGNEEKISSTISNIQNFLQNKKIIEDGLVEEMVPQLKKFALYIILNANLRTLEELVEKEEIGLVIWTIPTIPKLLMCEFIYNLHMERFLYEVAMFSYPPLAIELTAAFLDHLKYSSPTDCLNKLRKLTVACYTLICRLHLFDFGENNSKILTDANNNFGKCIKYYLDPPDSGKLNTLHKNDLYKYKGKCLTSALLFVYECFTQFTSNQEKQPNGVDDIYQLTYLADTCKQDITNYSVSDCSKDIQDLLHKCNETMLDACKVLVMDVSVDIFCAWSEFEEDGKTMQQTIGELCHKLRMKLLNISSVSEHPLVNMMEQISRKPADINDLINSADVATIKEKINNNEDSKTWIHALINKDQLCNHIELLDIINSNIDDYNEEECHKLYEVLKCSLENKDYTDILAVKAFHRCNITIKYELLDKQFTGNRFKDMQESVEFGQTLIETFNKLVIQPDPDLSDVLTLFLQNPRQVYTKLFNLAIENPQQTDIMLRVINLLQRYSDYYYESETDACLIKVTQNTFDVDLDSDEKENNFIRFLIGLKDGIIPATKILLLFVMPNAHNALLNEDIAVLYILIRFLTEAFPIEELIQYRAPMLAMIAQVFDVVRWNMHSFTAISPVTLQSTINLQQSFMDTYNNSIPENEGNWLRSKLKRTHSLNMYYYRQLFNPPGNNCLEILTGITVTRDVNREHMTTYLTRVLFMATQDEWSEIWDCLTVLEDTTILTLFHNALVVLSTAQRMNSSDNAWLCVLNSCRNFIYMIRYKFFKEPLTNEQVTTVLSKIAVLPVVKRGTPEEVEALLLPFFSYLIEKRDDYTYDLNNSNYLRHHNLAGLMARIYMRGPT